MNTISKTMYSTVRCTINWSRTRTPEITNSNRNDGCIFLRPNSEFTAHKNIVFRYKAYQYHISPVMKSTMSTGGKKTDKIFSKTFLSLSNSEDEEK